MSKTDFRLVHELMIMNSIPTSLLVTGLLYCSALVEVLEVDARTLGQMLPSGSLVVLRRILYSNTCVQEY